MNLLIISDAHLIEQQGKKVAYAPYVKEMDLWMPLVDQTVFVCPHKIKGPFMAQPFKIQESTQIGVRRLEFHTVFSGLISLMTIPYQTMVLWNAMRKADHIHLRAPGNLCVLACFVQMLFPQKKKTVKYAGNWDPNAKQPLAYRIQKWVLSNTVLSKNMQVLVYGHWEGMTKNIKPFFTASYFEAEKEPILKRDFKQPLIALFIGTLEAHKRPLEAVQLIHSLRKRGVEISLEMFGQGPLSEDVKWYCNENELSDHILLRGNQPAMVVKEAYKKAHFVMLLSKSEGWPKAVAEAMFWGAIPIVTKVSCVPWMLGNGKRGILINTPEVIDIDQLARKIADTDRLVNTSKDAAQWSRQYTLDTFAVEIEKLLL